MVAGAEASGAFKAKGIVVKFEHKEFFEAHPPSTPVASRIGAARCLS
jgi:hypothetical protein